MNNEEFGGDYKRANLSNFKIRKAQQIVDDIRRNSLEDGDNIKPLLVSGFTGYMEKILNALAEDNAT